VAKSAAGKWVSKVGASGGGKTYKKSRPGNYYGILAVIVILGVAATVYSRYEYQNPVTTTTSASSAPAIGSTIFSALSIQECGTTLPYLTIDPTSKAGGLFVEADNVIKVAPETAADAGLNANLKQFAVEYPGMILTNSEIQVPGPGGAMAGAKQFISGKTTCAAGTKYAGQTGTVKYYEWTPSSTTPTEVADPSAIHFTPDLEITAAFEPAGVTPSAPSKTQIDMLYADAEAQASAVSTTTTVVSSVTSSTVAPTTTTTAAPTTTTTAG
jgi:hypothetical protein